MLDPVKFEEICRAAFDAAVSRQLIPEFALLVIADRAELKSIRPAQHLEFGVKTPNCDPKDVARVAMKMNEKGYRDYIQTRSYNGIVLKVWVSAEKDKGPMDSATAAFIADQIHTRLWECLS